MEGITLTIIMMLIMSAYAIFGRKQQGNHQPRGRLPGMPTFGGDHIPLPSSHRTDDPLDRELDDHDSTTTALPIEQRGLSSEPMEAHRSNAYLHTVPEEGSELQQEPMQANVARQPTDSGRYKRTTNPLASDIITRGEIRSVDHDRTTNASHPLLDQQHIVYGIIWSEILSKPRSRRGGLR